MIDLRRRRYELAYHRLLSGGLGSETDFARIMRASSGLFKVPLLFRHGLGIELRWSEDMQLHCLGRVRKIGSQKSYLRFTISFRKKDPSNGAPILKSY